MDQLRDGTRVVCLYDDWINFLGEPKPIHSGMRLTVSGRQRVGGLIFLSFEQMPEGDYYLSTGFRPEVVN